MREELAKALDQAADDAQVERVLRAAFFRRRPLQAGATAEVVSLADRRAAHGEPGKSSKGTDGNGWRRQRR